MNLNWLKNLFNPALNRAKADALREIDRAQAKIDNGQTIASIVSDLRSALSGVMARYKLGGAVGQMLLDMVLAQVDWAGLANKSGADVTRELARIRKQVEGARL